MSYWPCSHFAAFCRGPYRHHHRTDLHCCFYTTTLLPRPYKLYSAFMLNSTLKSQPAVADPLVIENASPSEASAASAIWTYQGKCPVLHSNAVYVCSSFFLFMICLSQCPFQIGWSCLFTAYCVPSFCALITSAALKRIMVDYKHDTAFTFRHRSCCCICSVSPIEQPLHDAPPFAAGCCTVGLAGWPSPWRSIVPPTVHTCTVTQNTLS